MTEDDAQDWLAERYPPAAITKLEGLVQAVISENMRQNLIAGSTVSAIWGRHVVDSAQLLALSAGHGTKWLDVGTGAGFPGLVVACLRDGPVELVEPRKRRAEFLAHLVGELCLGNTVLRHMAVERTAPDKVDIISARAVASIDKLFDLTAHRTERSTTFLLPKGAGAADEVARVGATWHGLFHVEQSITDAASHIVVAREVHRCTA